MEIASSSSMMKTRMIILTSNFVFLKIEIEYQPWSLTDLRLQDFYLQHFSGEYIFRKSFPPTRVAEFQKEIITSDGISPGRIAKVKEMGPKLNLLNVLLQFLAKHTIPERSFQPLILSRPHSNHSQSDRYLWRSTLEATELLRTSITPNLASPSAPRLHQLSETCSDHCPSAVDNG